jgi:hypothetical protein
MNEEHAEAERKYIPSQLEEASEAIGALETLLANVSRDWTQRENRVLGHVVLSPPRRPQRRGGSVHGGLGGG